MTDGQHPPAGRETAAAFHARKRATNRAIFGAIIALAVLFFIITIVRMS